jgi:NAD(P)-dependent dehydrogenase (short-subunit alcohol dehydrogenase family)
MTAFAELDGKVAVVTGGASGIGRGIAEALRAEGAQVVIADIEQGALDATAAELGATGIQVDVADAASVQALADEVVERFGTAHVVVNNAGIGPMCRIADLTMDDWRWMVDVNLWGVIHGIQSFLPILKANEEGGHIVNTSSMAGLMGAPNLGSYTLTKFGVLGLTEVLAIELEQDGSKVGATVLCPGTIHTNIGTSNRNRPSGNQGNLNDVDISQEGAEVDMSAFRWMVPVEVGAIVVDAIKHGELYAITHPEWWPQLEQRFQGIAAAFGQTIESREIA